MMHAPEEVPVSKVTRIVALLLCGSVVVVAAACSGSGPGTALPPIDCGGESRPQIDCTSEINYQGMKTAGGFGVQQLVTANASHEETALRRVDEDTERFVAQQNRLCRDYNACVLGKDEYARETRVIRDRLAKVPELVKEINAAKTDDERREKLDELYRGTVEEANRVEEVSFKLHVDAVLPDSAGGGTIVLKPNTAVPTGARVAFDVEVSKEAHAYIFQKSPTGGVTVLFPNPKIGTRNPIPGKQRTRIPGGDRRFLVNDKDIGTEFVYIAVSRKPLSNLEASLAKFADEKATSIKEDNLLQSMTAIESGGGGGGGGNKCSKTRALQLEDGPAAPAPSGGTCTRSRGLELEGPAETGGGGGGSSASDDSIAAVTEPGDGLIIKVLPFQHTTLEGYASAAKSGGSGKVKTRGGIIQE